MKQTKNSFLIVLLLAFSITSCVTKKPIADSISKPDYNQRIEIENPALTKKENTVGLTVSVGITGLGGYLGYMSNVIKPVDDGSKYAQVGNTLLGTFVGYSVSRIVTYAVGKNKKVPVNNKNEWLNKLNSGFTFIDSQNNDKWVIINNNIEPSFIVKSLSDVYDFKKAFPNSEYTEKILSNSMTILNRDDIPKVLQLYPNTTNKTKYQLRYYELSENVSELKTAKNLYPESRSKFNICKNISTIISNSNKVDLGYLAIEYGNSNCKNKIDKAIVSRCSSIADCYQVSKDYPNYKDEIINRSILYINTIDDCKKITDLYPSTNIKMAEKAFKLASYNDYDKLLEYFPTLSNKISNKKVYLENGAIYNGYIVNGKPNGKGVYYDNYGYRYTGIWKDGNCLDTEQYYQGTYIGKCIEGKAYKKQYLKNGKPLTGVELKKARKAEWEDEIERKRKESLNHGISGFLKNPITSILKTVAVLKVVVPPTLEITAKILPEDFKESMRNMSYNNLEIESNTVLQKSDTETLNNEINEDSNRSIINESPTVQIIEDGYYKYGSYSSKQYKIICPKKDKSDRIYFNKQKKCWMKKSSLFCDYTSSNDNTGLQKVANYVCD